MDRCFLFNARFVRSCLSDRVLLVFCIVVLVGCQPSNRSSVAGEAAVSREPVVAPKTPAAPAPFLLAAPKEDSSKRVRFYNLSFVLPGGWDVNASEAEVFATSRDAARCGASTLSVRLFGWRSSEGHDVSREGMRCATIRHERIVRVGGLDEHDDVFASIICEARGEFELGADATVCDAVFDSLEISDVGTLTPEGLERVDRPLVRPNTNPDLLDEFYVPGLSVWQLGRLKFSHDTSGDGVDAFFFKVDYERPGEMFVVVTKGDDGRWYNNEVQYVYDGIWVAEASEGASSPAPLYIVELADDPTDQSLDQSGRGTQCWPFLWGEGGYRLDEKGACPARGKRGRRIYSGPGADDD